MGLQAQHHEHHCEHRHTQHNKQVHTALYLAAVCAAVFCPTAWAHDGDYGPLVAAVLIGPVLAIVITIFLPIRRAWVKLLLFFPIVAVCMVVTVAIAALLSEVQTRKRNAQYHARVEAFRSDPIAQAACEPDAVRVKALTSGQVSDAQQERYGEILSRCGFGDEPARKEVFAHLMPMMVSMQHGKVQNGMSTTYGYCDLLTRVHRERRMEYLQALIDQKLPISCVTTMGVPVWWHGVSPESLAEPTPSTATVSVDAWVIYLQKNGIALGAKGGRNPYGVHNNGTLINLVINQGSYELVMLGINAGGDTDLYARPANHVNSPIELWTVRRFKANNGLTQEQMNQIQAKFGELTAEQANRTKSGNGATLLWGLEELQGNQDGGAAFFTYLVSRGADLSARDQWGSSALYDMHTTSPQLLAAFDRLSPEQFKALVSPIDGPKSLLEAAKRKNNTVLINYLCSKGAKC